MSVGHILKVTLAFLMAALVAMQTGLWALLFRPWSDPLGFGTSFTLTTVPLSLVVGLFGGLWVSHCVHRREKNRAVRMEHSR